MTTFSFTQVQDDLRVYVAKPRTVIRQRSSEKASPGVWIRPRCGLWQNQGLHPHTTYPLQPGGAASRNGPENRPVPPEGEFLTSSR